MNNSFLLNSETDSDFVFKFTCSECGKSCLFSQYVDCRCPQCQSGMKVSDAKINISGNILKKQLWDLLLKKEQGDVAARRMLAVLSDSPDPDVRDLIERTRYEKLRGNEFQPLMPLEPERKPEPVSEPEKNLPSSAPKRTVEVTCPYCSRKKVIETSLLGQPVMCYVCYNCFLAKSSGASSSGRPKVTPPPPSSTVPQRTVEVHCPYCSRKKVIPTSYLGLYIKCNVCNSTFPTQSSGASSSGRTKVTPPPPSYTAPKRTVEVKCPYCSRKKLISTSFLGLYIKCNVCNSTFPTKSSGASSSGRTKVTPPPPSSTVPKRKVEVKCPYCSRKKVIETSLLGQLVMCNVCNSTFLAKSSNRR